MAGYVIEEFDEKSLVKEHGEYAHFEAIKPNEAYLQRLRSGPLEELHKTAEKITDLVDYHGQIPEVLEELDGQSTNIEEDENDDVNDGR